MTTIMTPITGNEAVEQDGQPYTALVNFYWAFNTANHPLMEQNWSQEGDTSMSNPLGDVKRGWREIGAVYECIFSGPAQVYVEFYDYSIHRAGVMFCAVGRERGYFRLNGLEVNLAIRTSRIYRQECGRWRQLHHHGSIDLPSLLERYQSAVRDAVHVASS